MIRFLTSGESHGKKLNSIVDGFPSNLEIDEFYINHHLKRRQVGYGRGERMSIENDVVNILSGIRYGKTLGSPICLEIENKDWENWTEIMNASPINNNRNKISIPRPGHADLNGAIKYNYDDIRNSIERSSARETAARVAACSIARKLLEHFNIKVRSFVQGIGGIEDPMHYHNILQNKLTLENLDEIFDIAEANDLRLGDTYYYDNIVNEINKIKETGDTLGGNFVVVCTGVPQGLGSFMHYDRKLDADIAGAIMSINAVKGVEIGSGFEGARSSGLMNNDVIEINDSGFTRKTNFAGGIEGGISNGMNIVIRGAMKPISTTIKGMSTIDLKNMKQVESKYERSDFTAVPACAIVAESMVCWILAKHFLYKFGGDSIEETSFNYYNYTSKLFEQTKLNFEK